MIIHGFLNNCAQTGILMYGRVTLSPSGFDTLAENTEKSSDPLPSYVKKSNLNPGLPGLEASSLPTLLCPLSPSQDRMCVNVL